MTVCGWGIFCLETNFDTKKACVGRKPEQTEIYLCGPPPHDIDAN